MEIGSEFVVTEYKPDHCTVPGCEEPCIELTSDDADGQDPLTLWFFYCETHWSVGENESMASFRVPAEE